MTAFENIRVGKAGTPYDTTQRQSLDGVTSYPPVEGVPTSPIYVYDVVPLTIQTNNIALSQVLSGAPATATLTAGTGVTTTTIKNTSVLVLDVPRAVSITGANAATAAIPFTVTGFDVYQQPMTQTFTGPAATAATTSTKAFKYIASITSSGNTVSGV